MENKYIMCNEILTRKVNLQEKKMFINFPVYYCFGRTYFSPLLRFSSSWRKETLKYNDDTYVTFSAQTSSIKWILSVRLACWTHFSTTLDANLCWDKDRTLPRTALIIWVLSSWNWRKLFLKIVIHILDFF